LDLDPWPLDRRANGAAVGEFSLHSAKLMSNER
jgi:hypothetical protein